MAHGLNLKVVAEGVETREQLEFMQTLDCDFAHGYLLGRPVSAAKLDAQIRAMRSTG
jgi:EAL domain-containing protein (putative c-di-GMP-specific phosphodiesterase class I)